MIAWPKIKCQMPLLKCHFSNWLPESTCTNFFYSIVKIKFLEKYEGIIYTLQYLEVIILYAIFY